MDQILVRTRISILDLTLAEPHAVIQITTDPGDWPALPDDPHRVAVLRMRFDDADPRTWREPGTPLPDNLFTAAMADQILEFVERTPVQTLVVHCEAGRSRSAAVAAAVGHIHLGDDSFIFDNPRYLPNRHVYRTLLDQHYGSYATDA